MGRGPTPAAGPIAGAGVGAGKPIGRRVVLGMLGLGGVGILGGARAQDWISRALAPVEAGDPTGLTSLIPAAGGFRIYSVVGSLPHRSEEDYRLKVDGLVERPLSLSVADLRAMPATYLVKDFQCVTGWRVRQVPWAGATLAAVLDAAGVKAGARALRFESFDGAYSESLTLAQGRRSDVIVAYEMLGKPVTTAHGGPVRMYIAPMYGYKSCKWLSRISVVGQVEPGYWEQRGYDVDGWVGRSNERRDAPVT